MTDKKLPDPAERIRRVREEMEKQTRKLPHHTTNGDDASQYDWLIGNHITQEESK